MAKKQGRLSKQVRKPKLSVTKRSNIRTSKPTSSRHAKPLGKRAKGRPGTNKPPRGFWNRASYSAGVKAGVIKDKKSPKESGRGKKEGQNEAVKKEAISEEKGEQEEREEGQWEEEDVAEDFAGEDLEYIQAMGFGESFLSGIDDGDLPTPPKKKKKDDADNKLHPFEMEPRSASTATADQHRKMKQLLPIKHAKGFEFRWEEIQREEKEANVEDVRNEEETSENMAPQKDNEVNEPEKPVLPALSTVELFTLRERRLAQRKQRIASLSHAVLTNPEENISKLKDLRMMLEEKERDVIVTVQKLVMVSLVEVFADIAPGYRIREWGEKAKSVELSKDVKRKREFEEALLKQYKAYLAFLEKCCRGIKKSKKQLEREQDQRRSTFNLPEPTKKSMAEVATRCLCALMTRLHHFNYRTNIVNVVVSLMVNESEEISSICCINMRQLFKLDHHGEAVLDAVRFISRLIRNHNYSVDPKVLNTFLSLKIKEVTLPDEEDKKKKLLEKKEKLKNMSRAQKRHQKRLAEVEKELQATEASDNKNKRKKLHTEIIQSVFATYFRILKKATNSILLSSVLEGLAKFAHLINVDFFDDLVTVLYKLIDSGELKYRESLHCVLTAFLILSGQGDVLNIDPTKFYTLLYVTMPEVHAGESSADAKLILDCLDAMIVKRHKQVTFQRVLAFLKRLATLALQMMPNGILGYCCAIRNIMKWYPKSDLLLDNDNYGSGSYLTELPEPEHCNAQSTALWELHLLKRHYHPTVREYAGHNVKGNPLTGPGSLPIDISRLSAQKICKEFNADQMNFKPPIDTRRVKRKNMVIKSPDLDYLQKDFEELLHKTLESAPDIKDLDKYLTAGDRRESLSNASNPTRSTKELKRKDTRTDGQAPRKKTKLQIAQESGKLGKAGNRPVEDKRLARRNGQRVVVR